MRKNFLFGTLNQSLARTVRTVRINALPNTTPITVDSIGSFLTITRLQNYAISGGAEDPTKEIVKITAVNGDVITVTRGQRGTTASAKIVNDENIYYAFQGLNVEDLEEIEEDITNVVNDLATVKTSIDEFQNDLDQNETNTSTNATDIQNNANAITSINSQITQLQTDLTSSLTSIGNIRTSVTGNTTNIASLTRNISSFQTRLQTAERKISAIEFILVSLQTSINSNTNDISSNTNLINQNTNDIDDNATAIAQNSTDITSNQTSITGLRNSFNTLQTTFNGFLTSFATLQGAVTQNTSNISQIQQDLSSANTNINGIQSDITGLRTSIGENDSDITRLKSDFTQVSNNLTANINRIVSLEGVPKYRGAWAVGNYSPGDYVLFDDNFYVSLIATNGSNNSNPSINTSDWLLLTSNIDISSLESTVTRLRTDINSNDTDIATIQRSINTNLNALNLLINRVTSLENNPSSGGGGDGTVQPSVITALQNRVTTLETTLTSLQTSVSELRTNSNTNATDIDNLETLVGSLQTSINNLNNRVTTVENSPQHRGAWAVGDFKVGDVVSFDNNFYICKVIRTSANTQNPSLDVNWLGLTTMTDISNLEDDVAQHTTDISRIDSDNTDLRSDFNDLLANPRYKGLWVPGVYKIGDYVLWNQQFYICLVARTISNTGNPSTNTNAWLLLTGAGGTGGGTSTPYDDTNVRELINTNVDNISQLRTDLTVVEGLPGFTRMWTARAHDIGDYVLHNNLFYMCLVARTETDTDSPNTDTTSWLLLTNTNIGELQNSITNVEGRVTTAEGEIDTLQSDLDTAETDIDGAQSSITSLETTVEGHTTNITNLTNTPKYKGVWSAGNYSPGDYVLFSSQFYVCLIARTSSNVNDPSNNSNAWLLLTATGGTSTSYDDTDVRQDITDLENNPKFKGQWTSATTYVIGDMIVHNNLFYITRSARGSSNVAPPNSDNEWLLITPNINQLIENIGNNASAIATLESRPTPTPYDDTGLRTDTDTNTTNIGTLRTDVDNLQSATPPTPYDDTSVTQDITALENNPKYRGVWSAGAYAIGDYVLFNNQFYVCLVARTSSNVNNPSLNTSSWLLLTATQGSGGGTSTPYDDTSVTNRLTELEDDPRFKGEWTSGETYITGDSVIHNRIFYQTRANKGSANVAPPISDNDWLVVTDDISQLRENVGDNATAIAEAETDIDNLENRPTFRGEWSVSNAPFKIGDITTYLGLFYIAKANRTSSDVGPPLSDNQWLLISPDIASLITDIDNNEDNISDLEADINAIETNVTALQNRPVLTNRVRDLESNGIRYRGDWVSMREYRVSDVVLFERELFMTSLPRNQTSSLNPKEDELAWNSLSLPRFSKMWTSELNVSSGDVLSYQEDPNQPINYYVAVREIENSRVNPATDTANWRLLTATGGGGGGTPVASTPIRSQQTYYDGNTYYVAQSLSDDSELSSAVWKVFRLETIDGVRTKRYADGNREFDNVAEDYLTLSYS